MKLYRVERRVLLEAEVERETKTFYIMRTVELGRVNIRKTDVDFDYSKLWRPNPLWYDGVSATPKGAWEAEQKKQRRIQDEAKSVVEQTIGALQEAQLALDAIRDREIYERANPARNHPRCTCTPCYACKAPTVCASCGQCTRCSKHEEGCPGCPASYGAAVVAAQREASALGLSAPVVVDRAPQGQHGPSDADVAEAVRLLEQELRSPGLAVEIGRPIRG